VVFLGIVPNHAQSSFQEDYTTLFFAAPETSLAFLFCERDNGIALNIERDGIHAIGVDPQRQTQKKEGWP
jgi:hypothetical protein